MEACRSPASTISTNERRMKAGRGAGRIFSVPQMIVKGGRGPGSVVSYLESFKRSCKDSGSGLRIKHRLKKTSRSSASSLHRLVKAGTSSGSSEVLHAHLAYWKRTWKLVEVLQFKVIYSQRLKKGGTGSADVVSIQQMLRKLLEVM